MEKFPQPNNEEHRDGFVVGESGEAVPARFELKTPAWADKLEKSTGKKVIQEKNRIRPSRSDLKTFPDMYQLKPIENGPAIKFLKEGDFVQWKNSSADQWEKPRRIKGFSSDGEYAFFEESATGIPTEELHIWDQKE